MVKMMLMMLVLGVGLAQAQIDQPEQENVDLRELAIDELETDELERRGWSWSRPKCSRCYNGGSVTSDGTCECAEGFKGRCCIWGGSKPADGKESWWSSKHDSSKWGWGRKCKECYNGGKLSTRGVCTCIKGYGGSCCSKKKVSSWWNHGKDDDESKTDTDKVESSKTDVETDVSKNATTTDAVAEEKTLDRRFLGYSLTCKKCYNGGNLGDDGKCTCTKDYWGKCCYFKKIWSWGRSDWMKIIKNTE